MHVWCAQMCLGSGVCGLMCARGVGVCGWVCWHYLWEASSPISFNNDPVGCHPGKSPRDVMCKDWGNAGTTLNLMDDTTELSQLQSTQCHTSVWSRDPIITWSHNYIGVGHTLIEWTCASVCMHAFMWSVIATLILLTQDVSRFMGWSGDPTGSRAVLVRWPINILPSCPCAQQTGEITPCTPRAVGKLTPSTVSLRLELVVLLRELHTLP